MFRNRLKILAVALTGGILPLQAGILVTTSNNTVMSFSSTGAYQWTSSGGSLNNPIGIAEGADGKVYVASNGNNTIQRFNATTGAYIDTFASRVNTPWGLDFDPTGDLLVASFGGGQILDYAANGTLVGNYTSGGGITNPLGLGFYEGDLYVTNNNGFISHFDSNGAYVGTLISGLPQPFDVQFGPDGTLYVSNWNSGPPGSLQRYNSSGTLLNNFAGSPLNPNGLAFGDDGYVYAVHGGKISRYDATTGALVDDIVPFNSHGLLTGNNYLFLTQDAAATPEPATMVCFALGGLLLVTRRRMTRSL